MEDMAGGSTSSTESLNGLKFGHKIYFEDSAPAPPKKVRSAPAPAPAPPAQPPRCQVEGCHVDLSDAKSYYSRHKVCGTHSKTPKVVVSGLEQRFCQQCSRFHQLPEFDQGKRSCRRRLAGHNERRRKPTPGSLLSARYEDTGSRVGGFLMDFSAYPRLGRDAWPVGRISESTPQTGKVLPYTWQGNVSENPPLSDLFLQTTAGQPHQVAGECFPVAAAADSSCALSLLSNQAWCPRTRSLSGFGHHSLGAPPMAAPLGGAVHQFPGTPWGGGSHPVFPDLGRGQISQPLAGDYSSERAFMETGHSGDYDDSGQHMHCSL